MYKSFKDLTPEEFEKVILLADVDEPTAERLQKARTKVVGEKVGPRVKEQDRLKAKSVNPEAEGMVLEELSRQIAAERIEKELRDELEYRGYAGGY